MLIGNNYIGETFEYPERVPFRLTHNMISAMGPLGVEGVFRKSCEFTLRVLRSNTATLMSIVRPFVYDPLVSWPRNVPAAAQSFEKVNELVCFYYYYSFYIVIWEFLGFRAREKY